MVGVDITSLNLPKIRDDLQLRTDETEESREFNVRTTLLAGYSVKQASFIAEWVGKNARYDVNTQPEPPREEDIPEELRSPVRTTEDNPFTGESQAVQGHMTVAGIGNALRLTAAVPHTLVNRVGRLSASPMSPAFLSGAGGIVEDSPSLPANPSGDVPPNALAPKNRGYRGGPTPVVPTNQEGPVNNPPPEMQDRVLTMDELAELREKQGHVAGYEGVNVPGRGQEQQTVSQGSGLAGTPETATSPENVREFSPEKAKDNPQLPEDVDMEERARQTSRPSDTISTPVEGQQQSQSTPQESAPNQMADVRRQMEERLASQTREQSGSNQPEHQGNGESGTPA